MLLPLVSNCWNCLRGTFFYDIPKNKCPKFLQYCKFYAVCPLRLLEPILGSVADLKRYSYKGWKSSMSRKEEERVIFRASECFDFVHEIRPFLIVYLWQLP